MNKMSNLSISYWVGDSCYWDNKIAHLYLKLHVLESNKHMGVLPNHVDYDNIFKHIKLLISLLENRLYNRWHEKLYRDAMNGSMTFARKVSEFNLETYVYEKISERNKQIFEGLHDYLIGDLTKMAIEYLG